MVRWNEIWQRVKKQKRLADLRATSHRRGFWSCAALGMDRNRLGTKAHHRTAAQRLSVCRPKQPQTETAQGASRYATGDKDSLQIIISTRVSYWKHPGPPQTYGASVLNGLYG